MKYYLFCVLSLTIALVAYAATNTDGDYWDDGVDTCTYVYQEINGDDDTDGYGNACDADYDNNGKVNAVDFVSFKAYYATVPDAYSEEAQADHNCDGVVNAVDYVTFKALYGIDPVAGDGQYNCVNQGTKGQCFNSACGN